MRVGLQTISFGVDLGDLDDLCSEVHELGYSGLEFSQPVDDLGDARELTRVLRCHQLTLAGFSGGSLSSRVDYARIAKPDFLYIDEWDEAAMPDALNEQNGFSVGIHPHVFKDIETIADAEVYLSEYPQLKLILDTAHLYLANEDILDVLRRYSNRVVAVHLKDWSDRYRERSPSSFSRGFVALGTGQLQNMLSSTIDYLVSIRYPGWIIVEQETPQQSPQESARISRKWLREHGLD